MRSDLAVFLSRGYLVLLLFAGVFLGQSPLTWVMLALLLPQAVMLYRRPPVYFDLAFTVVTLLLAPLSLVALIGSIPAGVLILPALALPDVQLRQLADQTEIEMSHSGKWTTRTLNSLTLVLVAVGILGLVSGSGALIIVSAVLLGGLAVRLIQEIHVLGTAPFNIHPRRLRILARSERRVSFEVVNSTGYFLRAVLSSPYPWLAIRPETFELEAGEITSPEAVVSPDLAGPTSPTVRLTTVGPWGLLMASYLTTPLELHVVPRARYAAWLAHRYLEASARGEGDVATVMPVLQGLGRARGIEYHRLREYEPGDQLRDVEWRHTLKLGGLIVKERRDPPQGSAILIVNLVVANPEEADWLAYHLVMSALSAALQRLPAFILAYDTQEPVLAKGPVAGREALKEALRLSTRLVYSAPIERLLGPPDVLGLRRTLRRLEDDGRSGDGGVLAGLLRVELAGLEQMASNHALSAMVGELARRRQEGSVVTVISRWNHDAEALAVILPWLRSRGYETVDLLSRDS